MLGLLCCAVCVADPWNPSASAQERAGTAKALTELSLEELMEIEVVSASRREEPLFEAAAAIHVLTSEDLRRSGATSVAEALRLVPGMQVASTNANQWAISARGFNNQFANKLLALIDGRSIYTPLFSGIYWDVQDLELEDVERVEIVRGPGATLWGANAVNGVINIITKPAGATPGWFASLDAGTAERLLASARYGGSHGGNLHYRVFARYHEHDGFVTAAGDPAGDDWRLGHGGGRLDWKPRANHSVTFQGDVYAGEMGRTVTLSIPEPPFATVSLAPADVGGGNLTAKWIAALSPRLRHTLQFYFDRTERRGSLLGEDRNTLDVDFEQEIGLGRRQDAVWGLGYRLTQDAIASTFVVSLEPPERTDHLFSAFVQDEIAVVPQHLRFTVGSKFEHNSYTGIEVQPSARLRWTPSPKHTAWGAVSRAVRTPSRVEDDVRFVLGTFALQDTLHVIGLLGNSELQSDVVVAWELGYRLLPSSRLFLDAAGFYNDYDELVTVEPGLPSYQEEPAPPHVLLPLRFANLGSGRTWGVELVAQWDVTQGIRCAIGYTWLEVEFDRDPASQDMGGDIGAGNDPEQQFQLRLQTQPMQSIEADAMLFYVDQLPGQEVPDYTRLDLRLQWSATSRLRLGLVGQNLLDPRHPEFGGAITSSRATEVPRGVYGQVLWRR